MPEYADLDPWFWVHIAAGQRIKAIKALRATFPSMSLRDARDIVDAIMKGTQHG